MLFCKALSSHMCLNLLSLGRLDVMVFCLDRSFSLSFWGSLFKVVKEVGDLRSCCAHGEYTGAIRGRRETFGHVARTVRTPARSVVGHRRELEWRPSVKTLPRSGDLARTRYFCWWVSFFKTIIGIGYVTPTHPTC